MRIASSVVLAIGLSCADCAGQSFSIDYGKVIYRGRIEPATVDRLISSSSDVELGQLVINSQGGEVTSAIRLAEWVLERGLEVRVEQSCVSSCANYVLPAGKRGVIPDGAIVLWHGGVNSRKLQSEMDDFKNLKLKVDSGKASSSEIELLKKSTKKYEHLERASIAQSSFYKRIKVDERILTLGQEPVAFDTSFWTVPVEVMRRFGLTQIDAPENFGTPGYIKKWAQFRTNTPKIISLSLDGEGRVIELN